MTGPDRLDRLAELAAMIRDAELARLAEASRRQDAARAALARFDAAAPGAAPGGVDATLIAARHQEWRAARRAQLNIALARETAAWSGVQDCAALAFGRSDVLARLARERRDKH